MSLRTVRNMIRATISLEDEGGAAPIVEVNVNVSKDAAEADEAAADVEEAQDDLDEEAADIDDQQEASDQVEETAANLESIALALEGALKEGGLGTQALTFANISINNELRRLGLEEHKVSLESMGTASGRIAQTKISLEEAQGAVAKAWEAIKAFFKKIKEAIVKFFVGLVSHAGRLERYGKKLEAVAAQQKKDGIVAAADAKVSLKDVRFLKKGSGIAAPAQLDAETKKIFTAGHGLIADFDKGVTVVAGIVRNKETSDKLGSKLYEDVTSAVVRLHKDAESEAGLIGKDLLAKNAFSISARLAKLGGKKDSVSEMMSSVAPAKEEQVKCLSPEEQLVLIKTVESVLPEFKKISEGVDKVIKEADSVIEAGMKAEGDGFVVRKFIMHSFRGYVSGGADYIRGYSAYAFHECMAILGYVHKSQKELAKTAKAA